MKAYESNFITGNEWEWELDEIEEVKRKIKKHCINSNQKLLFQAACAPPPYCFKKVGRESLFSAFKNTFSASSSYDLNLI